MTISTHYFGGPKDGCLRRTSSEDHTIGAPIVKVYGRGYYTSMEPWTGALLACPHVTLFWFYGEPRSHCEATDEWFAKKEEERVRDIQMGD